MKTEFSEDDYLKISGIQHYVYCPRQWALIHIEDQWADNNLTITGSRIHQRAHDSKIKERTESKLAVRKLKVSSRILGITGECDVVDFIKAESGVKLFNRQGFYTVYPIEYKKGQPKEGLEDVLQLIAEVLCLEEMFLTEIPTAYLYYYETRHRYPVNVTDKLRYECSETIKEMHSFYKARRVPNVRYSKKCEKCSLINICMPLKQKSVSEYLLELYREN